MQPLDVIRLGGGNKVKKEIDEGRKVPPQRQRLWEAGSFHRQDPAAKG